MSELALGIATGISLAMAAMLGVFEPRRINGPDRIEKTETSTIFLSVAGMGLFAWGGASYIADAFFHAQKPQDFTSTEKVVLNGAMDLAAIIGITAATLVFRPQGIRRLGAGLSYFPLGLLGGLVSLVIVLPLIYWVEVGSELMWVALNLKHAAAHDLLTILGNAPSTWLRVAIVVTAVVLAPLAEELFFRGQIQSFLRYVLRSPWAAVFITAACFALVHEWWTWPSIFFLGLALGYIYERTGNIWTCIILHALFNLASITIYVHSVGHA